MAIHFNSNFSSSSIYFSILLAFFILLCQNHHGVLAMTLLTPRLQHLISQNLLVRPNLPNMDLGINMDANVDVYVLGTVHIGSESAKDVKELIETVQPDLVVVELAPSRLERLRKSNRRQQDNNNSTATATATATTTPNNSGPLQAATLLPGLADRGWSAGGLGGWLFATTVMWPWIVRRSLTVREEEELLPRRDEFAATVATADALTTTVAAAAAGGKVKVKVKVVAADTELDDMIRSAVDNISPRGWWQLYSVFALETLGLKPKDPIQRQRNETIPEWAARRRNIATARASKRHGEDSSKELSKVLVDERDDRFAQACIKALRDEPQRGRRSLLGVDDDGDDHDDDHYDKKQTVRLLCIVGLVHLDGVVERLEQRLGRTTD